MPEKWFNREKLIFLIGSIVCLYCKMRMSGMGSILLSDHRKNGSVLGDNVDTAQVNNKGGVFILYMAEAASGSR